jgi:hypothetical protein
MEQTISNEAQERESEAARRSAGDRASIFYRNKGALAVYYSIGGIT